MSEIQPLIDALTRVANSLEHSTPYTLTGAADWPILAAIGGLVLCLISFMWVDLRSTIKDHRGEWEKHLDSHVKDEKESLNLLWDETRDIRRCCKDCRAEVGREMKECKDKCCDG